MSWRENLQTSTLPFDYSGLNPCLAILDKPTPYMEWATNFISMHQVLHLFASALQPAYVSLSSYSIGEDAARTLTELKNGGQAKAITLLLDPSAKANKLNYLLFGSQVVDELLFTPNHTKLLLIRSGQHCISVHSSANLTKNYRWEFYSFSSCPKVFSFRQNILDTIKANAHGG